MTSPATSRTVFDSFPLLKRFGLPEDTKEIPGYSLAGIVNSTPDQSYTVHQVEQLGQHFELRVCGLGDKAYFEWIDGLGRAVGGAFDSLTAGDIERLLLAVRP